MTLWTIVRHATTVWMEEDRFHGILDSPLSATGREEARRTGMALGRQPPFDAFYCSPSGRAVETARIMGPYLHREPQIEPRLREMSFGRIEGCHTPDMDHPPASWQDLLRRGLWYPWFALNRERWSSVRARVQPLLLELVARHPQGRLLLVCHYGTNSAIMTLLLNPPPEQYFGWYALDAAAWSEVEVDDYGRGTLLRQDVKPDSV
jgi:broad specificity phosphatase PhoE